MEMMPCQPASWERFQPWAAKNQSPGSMTSETIGPASPIPAIIATAKKHKCDLIVMASHGRRGIKRILLGSETQLVLTHSHIPVLVLR